ncbi:MAG TPA: SDR family NAD(P)-dependent oxidoreductase [Fimbriimonadaceae bacterium]|nr:SDR family NAD(P)-dependent oxidoreductase [Fimbriimonadaceae bacterium]
MQYKHAIVVGASSGIGLELVKQLAASGCRVAGVARHAEKLEGIPNALPFKHDVTHYGEVPALFQQITKELGGLDLIVYSSGVMPAVGAHEFNFEKDRQMVEVNLLGCIAWMNQAAIRFENTKAGSMVAIGSVAGDRGRAGQPVYNTTKAAMTTYMEAIRNRIAKYGVKVVTIKPGPTKTPMTADLHLRGAMDPAKVAAIILKKSRKTGEHYVKFSHRLIFYVIKRIPSPIFRRLGL